MYGKVRRAHRELWHTVVPAMQRARLNPENYAVPKTRLPANEKAPARPKCTDVCAFALTHA
eukprot:1770566-Pleurochrysis_carterae.AAC.1